MPMENCFRLCLSQLRSLGESYYHLQSKQQSSTDLDYSIGMHQYSIFSKEFKKVMYPQFVELNWVTGVSSPWITKYEVTKETVINPNSEVIEMRLDTATSNGPEPSMLLTISLVKDHNSWVITGVKPNI